MFKVYDKITKTEVDFEDYEDFRRTAADRMFMSSMQPVIDDLVAALKNKQPFKEFESYLKIRIM